MVICDSGKDVAASSATLVTRLPTFSCSAHRLLVPVWIRIWPGVPNSGWERIWSAASVVGHQIFDTFILGKSFCSWMNLPFESIRIATYVFFFRVVGWRCEVPVGEGGQGAGGLSSAASSLGGGGSVIGGLAGVRGCGCSIHVGVSIVCVLCCSSTMMADNSLVISSLICAICLLMVSFVSHSSVVRACLSFCRLEICSLSSCVVVSIWCLYWLSCSWRSGRGVVLVGGGCCLSSTCSRASLSLRRLMVCWSGCWLLWSGMGEL